MACPWGSLTARFGQHGRVFAVEGLSEELSCTRLHWLICAQVKIITLKIDGKAVVIDQEYPRSTTWESFHADQLGGALETEPRYVLLDHDYTTTDGRPADKIILISWIPDTSPVVRKSNLRRVRPE